MPLSWNEIKGRAIAFAKDWGDASDERAQAQSFWIEFFAVFGLSSRRVASFEHAVKKHGGGQGFVDLFWPGLLLVEHKSRGKSLDRAFGQAFDYFPGIKERDVPRYVVVCDFARLRLTNLDSGDEVEFALKDLHKHIRRFGFVAGYQVQQIKPQDPVNLRAAERMGKLHDALEADGYEGHALEVLLVRLLFCLFADDTGIFQPAQTFRAWVEERTAADGSDLGPQLAALFQVLNTPDAKRPRTLDEQLAAFPYVNGALFAQALPLAAFDADLRERLLDACAIDWSTISPAIFGALFQSIMKPVERLNPYLVDAPDVVLARRSRPLGDAPEIGIGNKPIDDGNYLFTPEQRIDFIAREPAAAKYFRRWIGAEEFINGTERWCLWLGDASPAELRAMPEAMRRVQAVKAFRLASRSAPTRALAQTPTRFHVENIPPGNHLIFPRRSGEARKFVPLGFGDPAWLVGDACLVSGVATPYHFGILTSTMHNAWVRTTCGRLESRYRYSAAIVYNNYPWPESPTAPQKAAIETAAQAVLDTRASFAGATLADLYDPLAMPPALLKAHQRLDAAVDAAYAAKRPFKTDAERVAFLFERYRQLTSLLPLQAPTKRRARRSISA